MSKLSGTGFKNKEPTGSNFKMSKSLKITKNGEPRAKIKNQRGFFKKKNALDEADTFAMIIRMFAYLIRDGYSISMAVSLLSEQASGIFEEPLKQVDKYIRSEGIGASEAFAKTGFFPDEFIPIIAVGERSGSLDNALEKYGEYLDSVITAKKTFNAALKYPTVILSMTFIMTAVILVYIVPTIQDVAKGMRVTDEQLPMTGKFIFALYDFMMMFGGKIGVFTIMSVASWYLLFGKGKAHIIKLLSLFPKVRKLDDTLLWSQWLIMGGICMKSGMLLEQMVSVVQEVVLPRELAKKGLYDEIKLNIRKGSMLSDELRKSNSPKMISQMIGIAEKSGRVQDAMEAMGKQMMNTVPYEIRGVSAFLEPLVIAVVTGMGGGIAGSVIYTLISISSFAGQ